MTTGSSMRRRRRTARLTALLAVLVCSGVASVAISACGGSSPTTTSTPISGASTSTAGSTVTQPSTATSPSTTTAPVAEPDSPVAGVEVIASNLQLALQRAGYAAGAVSGEFTPGLGTGLRSFQAAEDLAAGERGALGPATAAALGGGSAAVIALQSALTDVDIFHATINGSYDAATLASVRTLQRRAGITADGFYGPQTAAELAKLYRHGDPEPVDDAYTGVEETAGAGTSTAPAPTTSSSTTSSSATLPIRIDTDDLMQLGSTGKAVTRLQARLTVLGYRPGPADGSFGAATASAVLAFQKREGLSRDSVVGPSVEAVLAAPRAAGPPSGPAPRIDIDIARQLVFVVLKSGRVITLNSSTGNNEHYTVPGGGSDVAYTPVGRFTVIRKIPGDHHAPLGTLRSPLFFYRGWAIHGAANVPAYPASHGCARISNTDADWLYPQVELGEPVVVYDTTGKSPGIDNAPAGAAPGY